MYKKRYLFEQEEAPKGAPEKDVHVKDDTFKARKSKHSVDDQIDALILRYESSSLQSKEESSSLLESLTNKSLRFLFEQEEVEEAEEEPEEDSPPEAPTGSEVVNSKTKASKQIIPNLNIDQFANRTVRLINNPDSLLDIKTAIINRVKNFLDENYGDQFVTKYLDILEEEYGIETEEFNSANMEQTSDDTFAVGANASGAGAS